MAVKELNMIRFLLISSDVGLSEIIMSKMNELKGFLFLGRFMGTDYLPKADIALVDQSVYFPDLEKHAAVVYLDVKKENDLVLFHNSVNNEFIEFKDLLLGALSKIPFFIEYLPVVSSRETHIIRNTELHYLIADGHSVDAYFSNGSKLTIFYHLGIFENSLPLPFFRIHKSYMVNALAILRIQKVKRKLWLREGVRIPFSPTYAYQIELLECWLSGRKFPFGL